MESNTDVAESFRNLAISRHSTRGFLPEPVPDEIVEELLRTAQLRLRGATFSPGARTSWAVRQWLSCRHA